MSRGVLCLLALGLATTGLAATYLEYIRTSGDPQPGGYFYGYRDSSHGPGDQAFQKCLKLARESHQPLLIVCGSDSCPTCDAFCYMINAQSRTLSPSLQGFIASYFRGSCPACLEAKSFLQEQLGCHYGTCHVLGVYGVCEDGVEYKRSASQPTSYNQFTGLLTSWQREYSALAAKHRFYDRDHPYVANVSTNLCEEIKLTALSQADNYIRFLAVANVKYAFRVRGDDVVYSYLDMECVNGSDVPVDSITRMPFDDGICFVSHEDQEVLLRLYLDSEKSQPTFTLQYSALHPHMDISFPTTPSLMIPGGCCGMRRPAEVGWNLVSEGTSVSLGEWQPVDGVVVYTTDGSEPNAQSPVFRVPYVVNSKVNLRVRTIVDGYLMSTPVVEAAFAFGRCENPTIVPRSAGLGEPRYVEIHSDTEGAEIRYTTDGSDVTDDSPLYEGPFLISEDSFIKARVHKTDWIDGTTSAFVAIEREQLEAENVIWNVDYLTGEPFSLAVVKNLAGEELIAGIDYDESVEAVWNGYDLTVTGKGKYSGQESLWISCPYDVNAIKSVDGVIWCCACEDGVAIVRGAVGLQDCPQVEIPSEFYGLPVVEIGELVFSYCDSLQSVLIPKGVQKIGAGAFQGCSALSSVVIPDGVVGIGDDAFGECVGLMSVSVSPTVTSIGTRAFSGCHALSSVTIPPGVTNIGDYAFCDCYALEAVMIPEGVPRIAEFAFGSCGLTAVTIYEGVTSIGWGAFSGCPLTSVTIPSSVTSIEGGAFDVGDSLAFVYVKPGDSERVRGLYGWPSTVSFIEGGVECVGGFDWRYRVEDDCVEIIGCQGRENDVKGSLVIPSKIGGKPVGSIGEGVFSRCVGLSSVTLPEGVKRIGASAFRDCSGLTDVYYLGEKNLSVDASSFSGCYWDMVIHVPKGWQGRSRVLGGVYLQKDGEECASEVRLVTSNIVVHCVLNSVLPQFAEPVTSDTGFVNIIAEVKGGVMSVPATWASEYPNFVSKFGSDFTKALAMKTGKKDGAGNEMLVWQDYVAGTDPTDETDVFTASITIVDGKVAISYTPELDDARKAMRKYTTWGKASLMDANWTEVPKGDEGKYNFFKVSVEMQ